ncbi:MAG: uncharacterized protein H6Q37_1546, partial [Chloroflexi bacterium]|nr:uncharacterized protein [Chloroflexota bacterium]
MLLLALISIMLLAVLAGIWQSALAQADPTRQTTIVIPYTEYEWWLIQWQDNQILCRILVDHSGLPTPDEVLKYCGGVYYQVWLNTPPCPQAADPKKNITNCVGLYLHLVSTRPAQREVTVDLPPPTVLLTLDGCTPKPPENLCASIPALVFTGKEPLPNEHIIAIRGVYGDQPFTCPGSICRLPLKSTPLSGVTVEFWADSSYGDSSEHYTAQVRVIDTGVNSAPGGGGWYVDVISSQWAGPPLASCSRIWQALPPVGGPPTWLATPERSELLASGAPYFYLAGRLIAQGVVDAKGCDTGGMQPNGYADACGLEAAKSVLLPWQNMFDQRLVAVAK